MVKVVHYHESDEESSNKIPQAKPREIAQQRAHLPMYQSRHEVVEEIMSQPVTIIVGETGSGKSTQLPQALLEMDRKQNIVVSQPRRVAAISLGHRVAAEAGVALGSKVGYNVRFDSKVSNATRIRYVTDGMLLREFMLDPMLARYSTVIVDEAHERTVTSDLILGLLKQLLDKRRGSRFRVVVMSATLDADKFASFFAGDRGDKIGQLLVPGRAFGVDRFYLKAPVVNIVDAAAEAVTQVNHSEPGGGDLLVFLPGQEEIEAAAEILRAHRPDKGAPRLKTVLLYASLPEREQQQAFAPVKASERKVVLATNIAETSVTIPGVRYVIDSGIRKSRVYRSTLGLESLLPTPISRASASQRMGRAGREGPGKCWRLYTENTYLNDMIAETEPEISRVNVAFPILLLKRIGVEDVLKFPWIDPPKKSAIRSALLQLYTLRALNNSGNITPLGLEMATLPLDPKLAAVLVRAQHSEDPIIREAVIDVAACLSVQDLLITPSSARRQEVNDTRQELFPAAAQYGDLIMLKLIWDEYQLMDQSELKEWAHSISVSLRGLHKVGQVRKQLVTYLKSSEENRKKQDKRREEEEAAAVEATSKRSGHLRFDQEPESSTKVNAKEDEDESEEDEDDEDNESRLGSEEYNKIIKAFLEGYVGETAVALPNRQFQTVMTQNPVNIHPGSALFGARPEAIMYLEYVYTVRGYARYVSPISIDWLREIAPHLLARATLSME